MKIKGTAQITKYFVQPDGSQVITQQSTEENLVLKLTYQELLAFTDVFTDSTKIVISSTSVEPDYETTTLSNILAFGNTNGLNDSRVFTSETETEPSNLVIKNRFQPPTAERTINSLALTKNSSGSSATVYTYLKLSTPIVQSDVEILDISYKIFIDWSETTNISKDFRKAIEKNLFDITANYQFLSQSAAFINHLLSPYSSSIRVGSEDNFYSNVYKDTSTEATNISATTANTDVSYIPNNTVTGGRFTYQTNLGRIWTTFNKTFASTLHGTSIRALAYGKLIDFDEEEESLPIKRDKTFIDTIPLRKSFNLSNVFSHATSSERPMYDANNLANSSWQPQITKADTPDFPTEYFLKVTKAGGAGVGEYKLYKTAFQSWYDPSGRESRQNLFWEISGNSKFLDETDSSFIFNHRWVYDWSSAINDKQWVTYRRKAGVALLQMTDRSVTELKKYTLSAYPQLGNLINDVAVNPSANLIYVATESGLFSINVLTDQVSTLSADNCLSVCVGLGGRAYAIFQGVNARLSNSLNWATALDLTGATINFDNCWRIFIDPESSSYDLMFYEGLVPKHTVDYFDANNGRVQAGDVYKIHWWNETSNFIKTDNITLTDFTDFGLHHEYFLLPTNKSVVVTNGLWIYPGGTRLPHGRVIRPSVGNRQITSITRADYTQGIPNEIRFSKSGLGWNTYPYNSSVAQGRWNEQNNRLASNNSGHELLAGSGDYLFGNHAATPFATYQFEGSLCLVLKEKPETATNYSLELLFGIQYHDAQTSTTFAENKRFKNFFKVTIDETNSSNNVKFDYPVEYDNSSYYYLQSSFITTLANYMMLSDKRIAFLAPSMFARPNLAQPRDIDTSKRLNVVYIKSGGIGFINQVREPNDDLGSDIVQEYYYDGTNWLPDNDHTGDGKPLHTTTEALIDGLEISWTDLNPSSTRDLIENQYYNFVKITEPNTFLIEETQEPIQSEWYIWYRQINSEIQTGTVPTSGSTTVPLSKSGEDLFLTADEKLNFSGTINGNEVEVLHSSAAGTSSPGVIYIINGTDISFDAADSGRSFELNYQWVQKYHETEDDL